MDYNFQIDIYTAELASKMEALKMEEYDDYACREYQKKAEEECMKTLFDSDEDLEEDIPSYEVEFPKKSSRRAYHLSKTNSNARRKEKLANEIYPGGFNAPHGYFRKGKIHCSCPMCTSKTNDSINKSRGPVCGTRNFSRLAVTHHRYGKKNYQAADRKKIDSMKFQKKEYFD